MNFRSAALRSVAPLLLSVLIAGRQAPAYSGATLLESGTLTLQGSSVWTLSYGANTGGVLAGIVPTIAPAPPQLEIIQMDRTGHPVNGIPDTYQPKYHEGYDVGYATGYDSGLATGKQRGIDEGTATGRSDGYNKGFGETYQPAFDLAYNTQLPIGKEAGWNQGQINGFAAGYDWAPTFFGSGSISTSTNSGISGSFSGIMLNSGGYGINSNARIMSPDEVPGFYYQLGLDDGNKEGTTKGSSDGFKLTYADAYAAAFPIGYENGTVEGTSQGIANGNREGFSAGWDWGYALGYDSGFDAGIQHYLSGHQPMSTYGTLEVTLSGSSFLGAFPVISLGATSDGVDLGSEPSVPEPTSFALMGLATAVVMLRRAGRS